MSRIGNKLIPLPSGVKVQLKPNVVEVQGPKGKMSVAVPRGVTFEQKDSTLVAKRETEEHRALHGLARALVANAVTGVTQGFKRELDIVGVGLPSRSKGQECRAGAWVLAPNRVSDSRGNSDRCRKADAHDRDRGRQRPGGASGCESARACARQILTSRRGFALPANALKKKAGKAGAKTTA